MDISIYFEPIDKKLIGFKNIKHKLTLGYIINSYSDSQTFPELDGAEIAIVGVKEDRNALNNEGCRLAPDYVRSYFYKLYHGAYKANIIDLGNIKAGFNVEDTYYAVTSVITELLKRKITPIIIGGSQDLTYANYMAYESLNQIVNIVSLDSSFDLGDSEEVINSQSYLNKIILHQPNFLFNYTNIGYQTYFVDQDAIELMRNLYFDVYRLGQIRADMEEVEPLIRNADIVSFDVSCIRQSDAPGNGNATPNGFYGEEACQIVRYAGISDKLSSIGFYEINPASDKGEQTSHLVAQMMWYFLEGFYNRKKDFPYKDKDEYIKYRVLIKENHHEIVFYKSKKSDRWWMEVPCPANLQVKYERHYLVPCSYRDYQTACNEQMPERWWQVYQKLI